MSHSKVMIMAGGTGGHVYPAMAVAEYLTELNTNIVWLGTKKGLEADVVPKKGYPLLFLDVKGVRGKSFISKLISPLIIIRAIIQSIKIIRQQKPDVVLGMGGFVSGPGGIAAYLLRVPLCIHEQNAIAGLTNKLLRPFASIVLQAFPGSFNGASNVITVGNPVRKSILTLSEKNDEASGSNDEINILIVGGSLGARTLNRVVPKVLKEISLTKKINIKHQTGKKNFSETEKNYHDVDLDGDIVPYIDDIAMAYRWADLVICRSGAMTISELAIVGIASILIPYPYAVDDHQTMNARYLSDHGYAILIRESDLSESVLKNAINKLTKSKDYLKTIAESVKTLGMPKATSAVAEKCLELAHV